MIERILIKFKTSKLCKKSSLTTSFLGILSLLISTWAHLTITLGVSKGVGMV